MSNASAATVAIIDYGMGNLFSVKHACEYVGMNAVLADSSQQLLDADAVIIPGVGAFGDAMDSLRSLDLVKPLQDVADSGKPLIGICLGMQLLLEESQEFGAHEGLGLIQGLVLRLNPKPSGGQALKVPQVGWNGIYGEDSWDDSLLNGLSDGEYMFFVHSYYARPEDNGVVMSTSTYGGLEFCSGLRKGNVFGLQFHPERSGPEGLRIYRNLAQSISANGANN